MCMYVCYNVVGLTLDRKVLEAGTGVNVKHRVNCGCYINIYNNNMVN